MRDTHFPLLMHEHSAPYIFEREKHENPKRVSSKVYYVYTYTALAGYEKEKVTQQIFLVQMKFRVVF